ncbi:hypothetical protein J1N35_004259 [Gossypium stocksii]|uniref:Uncharacterized protein n=1 Tax=Gossypium stocksii TaxID=47602 RepID=A0A9D4AHH8_9ROSI|nr:hypothetical protein J1N35_004259 [Gossypium stocksii]
MEENPVKMAVPDRNISQNLNRQIEEEDYGPWMLVERRKWRNGMSVGVKIHENQGGGNNGSRFEALGVNQGGSEEIGLNMVSDSAADKETLNDSVKGKKP